MEKLNKAIITISLVIEILLVVTMLFFLGLGLYTVFGGNAILAAINDGSMTFNLSVGGFAIDVLDENGNVIKGAVVLGLFAAFFAAACMTMIVRNINLIFRTAEGKTWFSKGETPFQPDTIRMVREIGIFCIMIPVIELILSIIAKIILPVDMIEASVDLTFVLIGLVVLALSQYFAYGMKLENEVEGLV